MFGELNEKQDEYLDDILASGATCSSLINDILDLSKVEAGRMELEVAPFSLPEALERGVVMVRERATNDGVALTLAIGPGVDLVDGDERKIRQVIFNLLSNAMKFTPAGRQRSTSAPRASNGEVRVSVADTGRASPPRTRTRIFEEFQQIGAGEQQRRGDGARAGAVEAARRAAWRPDLGRERARRRAAPSCSRCLRGD